jgi:hypothetical protein
MVAFSPPCPATVHQFETPSLLGGRGFPAASALGALFLTVIHQTIEKQTRQREMQAALAGKPVVAGPVGAVVRWNAMLRLAELTLEVHASRLGGRDVRWMLDRLLPLTQGLPGSRRIRDRLRYCLTLDDLRRLRDEHLTELANLP